MQRIRARLGRSRIAARGRTLNVAIVVGDGQFVGKLSLVEADGRATSKTLADRDCDDLVDALALVAALAVEDGASDATDSAPQAIPEPSATAAPAAPSATTVPSPPSVNAARVAPSTGDALTGIELGALLAVGPAPAPIYGAVLSFDWISLGDGWLRPAFQLGLAAGIAPDLAETSGTARFAWLHARAAAYVLRWAVRPNLVVRGGADPGDIGTLLARGLETSSPASTSRGWLSFGVAASVEVPCGSRFTIRSVLGVEAPLRRDRYAFGSVDFFEVPLVIATGSVAVMATF